MECPICGSEMVIKSGKYGEFYGCVNFPKCKGSKSIYFSSHINTHGYDRAYNNLDPNDDIELSDAHWGDFYDMCG